MLGVLGGLMLSGFAFDGMQIKLWPDAKESTGLGEGREDG